MQELLRDGTEQTIYTKISNYDVFSVDGCTPSNTDVVLSVDGGSPSTTSFSQELTGESDGEILGGISATLLQTKKPIANIQDPVVTWDANIFMWGVTIPPESLTQYGNCFLTLQYTGVIDPTTVEFRTVSVVDTAAYIKSELDLLPTALDIVSAFDSEVVDGAYTRIQVERIVAAVLLGTRGKSGGLNTYYGLDGTTPRLISTLTPDTRLIIGRDGDQI